MSKSKVQELLLEEYSRAQVDRIIAYIDQEPDELSSLWEAFHSKENLLAQRSAWAIQHYYKGREEVIIPRLTSIIPTIEDPVHPAQIRGVLSILQDVDIPQPYESYFYELGLKYMCDPKAPSAIRVFGMQVASNTARKYPELADEVIHSYELLESRTAGLKSRWKKLLNDLKSSLLKEQA